MLVLFLFFCGSSFVIASFFRLFARAQPRRRLPRHHVLVTSRPQHWAVMLKELWHAREIAMIFIRRDISVQYKQTLIGILWFLLRPIATVAIFATIFRYIVRFPAGETPYTLFVMSGIVPWLYFSDAFQKGINCLQGSAGLITRIYFPRIILPISLLVAPLADLGVGMGALLLVMLLYGVLPPPHLVFLPFFVLLLYLFALGLSLCIAGPQAIFRDIGILLGFALLMWLYLTPIIYPLDILPSFLQNLLIYNPLTGIVQSIRWSVLGYGELPVHALGISIAVTALLLIAGVQIFTRLETHYIDQV